MNLLLFLFSILVNPAVAQKPSPLCENLSRFSCAPGTYDDGTGVVKSGEDLEKETSKLREKHKERSKKLAQETWNSPNNSYFKDKAIAAMGLKNSPDCASEDKTRQAECEKRALEGLADLIERASAGSLLERTPLNSRGGNIQNQSYLIQDHKFKAAVEKAQKEVSKDITDPKLETKIKDKIFPQIAAAIAEKLKSLPISEDHKKFMISKVTSIKFDGVDCNELGGQGVNGLLIPNAFYMPSADTFKICNALGMQSTSEFAIANVIAHELSHSIDPCNLSRGPKDTGFHYSNNSDEIKSRSEYPIPNIIACLRSSESLKAADGKQAINAGYGMGGYPGPGTPGPFPGPGGGMVGQPPAQPPQDQDAPESHFCNRSDQMKEAFSDWIAAEVTPIYIEKNHKLTTEQYQIGYSNIWRSRCTTGTSHMNAGAGHGTHPETEDRIDKMILVQPKIRDQMKCPPTHSKFIYCDPNKPFAQERPPRVSEQKANSLHHPVPEQPKSSESLRNGAQ